MADNIMSSFAGFGNIANVGKWILIIGGMLIFAVVLFGAVILVMVKLKEKKIIEINQINKKVMMFSGREKKNRGGRLQTWVGKLKKWLPKLQEEDIYLMKGNKDMILLLKDNNGLHHSLRIPTQEELTNWYKSQNINLTEKIKEINKELKEEGVDDVKQQSIGLLNKIKDKFQGEPKTEKAINVIGTCYLLPNVLEDLNWMAEQSMEADKTFANSWWQNPAVVWLGTFALLTMLTIMWLIIMKRV